MEFLRNKFLMWTDIEIIINFSYLITEKEEFKVLKDIEESFNIFYTLEKEFSRFDENSDLYKLNKSKILEVSSKFIEILNLSKKIYKNTNWYFNPLINISDIWYDKSFEKITLHLTSPNKREIEQNLELDKIQIIWNKIILQDNQNLDFWWIIKWYTVDLVKEFLEKSWYDDFIVNAGWDMYISKKSTIAIDSPEDNWDIFALLDLENISLSTSWIYKRKWKIKEENFHHILNPKRNINNNEIVSISLITEKCYLWDAYATACIAMWIEKSIKFLEKENINWVIIWNDKKVYKIWKLEKYNFEII